MTLIFAKVWFWVLVLFGFVIWGMATDPSRKGSTREKRSEMAEGFADQLERGAPRDE